MSKKSKTEEMRQLRAAGLTLAHAERLSQNKRGPGMAIAAASGLALVLVGGIVALGFEFTRTATPTQAAALAAAANPTPTPVIAPAAVDPDALAQQTLAALTEDSAAVDCTATLGSRLRGVSIPFQLSSTTLSATEAEMLNGIVANLNTCEEARLMINGHSDGTGEELTNIQLSWKRAEATMALMIALGAQPSQLEAVGFGARVPMSPDAAPADAANRRVDFRVLRNQGING